MSLSAFLGDDGAANTTAPDAQPTAAQATSPTAGSAVGELAPGDVVFFSHQHIHALLREAGDYSDDAADAPLRPVRMDIEWLDGYSVGGRTRNVRREDLEALAADGKVRLIAEGVANRHSRWAATGARHPDQHAQDQPVQPKPRVRADKTTFTREFSRDRVNGFLRHPVVDHKHGRVAKAKAMFTARRPDDELSAVATVNVPNARQACDRHTVEITRYASHPEDAVDRDALPNNTGTRMLARIYEWAALEGFENVRALAGTDGNDGGIYQGANFQNDGTACSTGSHNRNGRSNHDHTRELTRYLRSVDVDGEDGSPGVPRRVEGRLGNGPGGTVTAQAGLASFSGYDGDARPAEFGFVREDVTDTKFARDDAHAPYSGRARDLFAAEGRDGAREALAGEATGRGRYAPAAVFGADVDGTLVAALAVTGNPRSPYSEARVLEYASRETAFPGATARWLLTRARDWAELEGYDVMAVPEGVFSATDGVQSSLPAGLGFEAVEDGGYRMLFR